MEVHKLSNETDFEYRARLYALKQSGQIKYTWEGLSNLIELETGKRKSGEACRKEAKKIHKFSMRTPDESTEEEEEVKDSLQELILEFKKERYKLSDERTQNNAYIRRMSREETIIELSKVVAKEIGSKKFLDVPKTNITKATNKLQTNEAILQISDWHYGLEVNNYWNHFNPEICLGRVLVLQQEVIEFCKLFNVKKLHVVNLSDLIAGRIHNTIRLESRMDVISQCIEVSEILAEFLSNLSNAGLHIEYYDCLDNHSRLEPIKSDSLDLESLARIIPWYLKTRLIEFKNIKINNNKFSDDIITFEALNGKYKVASVHGHKDKPSKVVDNLTLMTKTSYDLILSAHLHHFMGDEKNETLVISNGSLMGVDSYAKDLRVSSKASQNIILVNEKSVADYIHRIVLN